MSILTPLTVRMAGSRGAMDVTDSIRDLVMRWTDPGGYASCQVALDRPLSVQPDEIQYYGNLTVSDARHGGVVWDGRQEDPGRSAGASGEVWDIAAVGGQTHTLDRTVSLIYVDQPLSGLDRVDNVTPGGSDGVGADPGDATGLRQALVLRIPQGTALVTDSRVVVRYSGLQRAGMKIARVAFTWDAGFTSASVSVEAITRTDGSLASGDTAYSATWTTAGASVAATLPTITNGRNTLDLRMHYTSGAGSVSADTWWQSIYNLVVRAMLVNRSGADITTGYTANTVLASEVVTDLLGRLLNQFDAAGATITTSTYGIDKLAYPDGATPNKVLADLLLLEPGMTWRVWERNATGKYRFEFVPVPTGVRYEVDEPDAYESAGSADGIYNRVTVRWQDSKGASQATVRTSTVPLLDSAGLIRQGSIDLGTEIGSLAAAQQAGDRWLADRAQPSNAGRLTVSRPILDLTTGRMVMPWEIRPGLIRVRGVLPRADALNATSRDGVTIFRIVSSEFRLNDAAATLELDSYAPSTVRMLSDARRATIRR